MVRIWLTFFVAFSVLAMNGCSMKGETHGYQELPVPIILTMSSVPTLQVDNRDPNNPNLWVLTVGQTVQFHVTDPTTGNSADNKVLWTLTPLKSTQDHLGSIDRQGLYTAPSTSSWAGIFARADNLNPPLRGDIGIEIVAAPVLSSFAASATTITSGQSVALTPLFASGQGQILVGSEVVQSNLVSGTPMTVSPTISTTYTLVVTNLAGASVRQDLRITVQ